MFYDYKALVIQILVLKTKVCFGQTCVSSVSEGRLFRCDPNCRYNNTMSHSNKTTTRPANNGHVRHHIIKVKLWFCCSSRYKTVNGCS